MLGARRSLINTCGHVRRVRHLRQNVDDFLHVQDVQPRCRPQAEHLQFQVGCPRVLAAWRTNRGTGRKFSASAELLRESRFSSYYLHHMPLLFTRAIARNRTSVVLSNQGLCLAITRKLTCSYGIMETAFRFSFFTLLFFLMDCCHARRKPMY